MTVGIAMEGGVAVVKLWAVQCLSCHNPSPWVMEQAVKGHGYCSVMVLPICVFVKGGAR